VHTACVYTQPTFTQRGFASPSWSPTFRVPPLKLCLHKAHKYRNECRHACAQTKRERERNVHIQTYTNTVHVSMYLCPFTPQAFVYPRNHSVWCRHLSWKHTVISQTKVMEAGWAATAWVWVVLVMIDKNASLHAHIIWHYTSILFWYILIF